MTEPSRHDAWQAGDSYDSYMGRWSRQIAPRFLDWLDAPDGLEWLEVGCGTGALSAGVLARCNPKSLISIDPSEGFLAKARATVSDGRAEFQMGDAGPAPGYCMSLDPEARQRLKEKLQDTLPIREDGSIPLRTRAWAIKALVA